MDLLRLGFNVCSFVEILAAYVDLFRFSNDLRNVG